MEIRRNVALESTLFVRAVQAREMTLSWFQLHGWQANIPQVCQPVMTFRDLYSFRRNRGLKSEVVDDDHVPFELLGEKRPLRANFHKRFPKGFMRTRKHVSYANFVKFGRPEVGKVVRYLLDKKKQNFGTRSRSRFWADRAQNLSGPAPDNKLGVSQISSKSVHFRRSYSRRRKHRWNAPQSVSNTRRSFFAE